MHRKANREDAKRWGNACLCNFSTGFHPGKGPFAGSVVCFAFLLDLICHPDPHLLTAPCCSVILPRYTTTFPGQTRTFAHPCSRKSCGFWGERESIMLWPEKQGASKAVA